MMDIMTEEMDTTAAPGTEPKTEITDAQLIENLDIPFEMMDMNLLVKPLEPVMVNKVLTELDDKKNKNLKPGQLAHTRKFTKEVQATYRKGVILAMGPNVNFGGGHPLSVGDTVIFHNRVENNTIDLYRDALLLRKFDIEAKCI